VETRDIQPGHFYRSLVIADRRWPYHPNPSHWAIVRVETRSPTGGWVVTDLGLNERLFILSPDLFLEEVPSTESQGSSTTARRGAPSRHKHDWPVPRWLGWVIAALATLCGLGVLGWGLIASRGKITW
jgi:hypothetical protein